MRNIVVAGAGIGGLTAALALAHKGFAVALADKAEKLEETGAGIQLSPNATRVLCGLGLRERLAPAVVAPEGVIIKTRRNREIARLRLGAEAERRYGAPYWMIHRGDLQAALLDGVIPRIVVVASKIERLPSRYLPRLHLVNLIRKAQDEPAHTIDPGNHDLIGMQRAAHVKIAAIAIVKVGLLRS